MKLPNLTEKQLARVLELARDDAKHWLKEAKEGTLPNVEKMHLDWQIDDDLREVGVDDQVMQDLSFKIARQLAKGKEDQAWSIG